MKQIRLEDGLEMLLDHRGKTPKKLGADFVDSGVPVASAILVTGGRLDLAEARFVSEETFTKWMPARVRRGDVLLTSEAPLGRVARVESDAPLVLGQRLYGLRGKAGVLDSAYLYYVLQTDRVQADLIGRSTGTTVFGIRQSALRDVTIPVPGYSEQRAIAEVLGALDDKIRANTKLATTADDLARTSYLAFARRSDGKRPLGDLLSLEYGKALPATVREPGRVPVFGSGGLSGWHNMEMVPGPGIVVGRKGSVGTVYWSQEGFFPIDTTYFVRPAGGVPLEFLYYLIADQRFGDANSDSAVPGLNRAEAYRTVVPYPGESDVAEFANMARALIQTKVRAGEENRALGAIRDALLPALMSGRLRVDEAAEVAGL